MAKISLTRFEESNNGINIEAIAKQLAAFGFAQDKDWIEGIDAVDGFRWLQTVKTNSPLPPQSRLEYVDHGKDFPDPFYNQTAIGPSDPDNKFEDFPQRKPGRGRIVWNATLTLVAVNLKEKRLVAHDIRAYGFELTIMRGTQSVGEVKLVKPTLNWSDLKEHRRIVKVDYPDWKFSEFHSSIPPLYL